VKKEVLHHPKTTHLSKLLNIPPYAAWGILEAIWIFTSDYAPSGSIGKFENSVIADAVRWDRDPDELINALIKSGFLDACECGDLEHRLIIHDWKDHCQERVQVTIRRKGLQYATACRQTADKVPTKLRQTADKVPTKLRQTADKVPTDGIPNHTLPNHTLPNPTVPIPDQTEPETPTQSGTAMPPEQDIRVYPDADGTFKVGIDDPLSDGTLSKLTVALKAIGIQPHRIGGRLWNRITTDADSMASGDQDLYADKIDEARAAGMTSYDQAASWIRQQDWNKAKVISNGSSNKISRIAAKPGKYDNIPSRLPATPKDGQPGKANQP